MYHKCMISWETTHVFHWDDLCSALWILWPLCKTLQNRRKSLSWTQTSDNVLPLTAHRRCSECFDAFTELHEWSVKLAIQVASACDDVLANVYTFMDVETGMLQDAGFSALCLWHTVILSFDLVFFCCQGLRFNDVLRLLLNQPLSCFRADNQLIDLDLCLQWIR